ncbi:MAG TPA: DUF1641 domain-containing protein [Bryobacteraceae bacterium]|jgi:uncharacterized protein YjgD (DUF1641 family)|nr:DUF1641 domain-containing protein [Bryobacteraceae bacterium]
MAKPILLELPTRDPREELRSRLQSAPLDNAEALLAGYAVLKGLHDSGVLELLQGLLGSGSKVLEIAVGEAQRPESVQAVRNLLVIGKILTELDPALLNGFAKALPQAVQEAKEQQKDSPGVLDLLKLLRNEDMRRGLVMMSSLLEACARSISHEAHSESKQ